MLSHRDLAEVLVLNKRIASRVHVASPPAPSGVSEVTVIADWVDSCGSRVPRLHGVLPLEGSFIRFLRGFSVPARERQA